MIDSYTELIVILAAVILLCATFMAVWLRPRPWRNIFRGSEAAICVAFALDKARSLAIIGGGTKVPYPGDVWALVNIAVYGFVAVLMYCRVSQIIRHRARDKETWQRFAQANTRTDD